ncbi:MAG: AAA family ATPase [Thermodesulfovibrionales bacterium]
MLLELNEFFLKALHLMDNSDVHVFITGRAGTGKSTLLNYFRKNTKKNIAILAPTGVAAVNIKGQTIHSFFNFRPDITPFTVKEIRPRNKELYKKLDAIVIDEISMVRADLLDSINEFLKLYGRKKTVPFGGIKFIFIGDLYQLPPVVTSREMSLFSELYRSPYFFDARVFEEDIEMEFIELEKVYRQKDEVFLSILNAIRNNTVTDRELAELNKRYMPDFVPDKEFYIYLTTTNSLADSINRERLDEIKGRIYSYEGFLDGDFKEGDLPAPLILNIKIGSQVMLLNNDSSGRWVNGSIGRVVDIERQRDETDIIWVELENKDVVDVTPYTWEMFEFTFDRGSKTIVSDVVGTFTQYPLRLAWAITIHKSQGLTFDRVIIDIGRGTFSHGQLYVALSRCTSLEGLILKRPVMRRHVLMDRRVVNFITGYQYRLSEKRQPLSEKLSFIERAIKEGRALEIVYLKAKDEKSRRLIIPYECSDMEFKGKTFKGLRAFCTKRNEERVFNIERILELRVH